MADRWALRRALKQDRDLYDTRRRVRLDLDEIAHPWDVAQRHAEFRDWGSWHEDLAGLGLVFKPRSILEIGVGLGYSGYSLCSGALLSGRRRLQYVGIDVEQDTGPPTFGYRTLAMAAETFRRHLPDVRGEWHCWDTVRFGLPDEVEQQCFNLIHIDGDGSEEGTAADLRLGWGRLAPGGVLVASRLHNDARERGVTNFYVWLLETDELFESQWIHNSEGMTLFGKEKDG